MQQTENSLKWHEEETFRTSPFLWDYKSYCYLIDPTLCQMCTVKASVLYRCTIPEMSTGQCLWIQKWNCPQKQAWVLGIKCFGKLFSVLMWATSAEALKGMWYCDITLFLSWRSSLLLSVVFLFIHLFYLQLVMILEKSWLQFKVESWAVKISMHKASRLTTG